MLGWGRELRLIDRVERSDLLGRVARGIRWYPPRMAKRRQAREALPNFTGAGLSIGGFMAGLEQQILHNRPPAAIVVEEEARSEPRSVNGLQLDGPDEPIERPEPPDASGARL